MAHLLRLAFLVVPGDHAGDRVISLVQYMPARKQQQGTSASCKTPTVESPAPGWRQPDPPLTAELRQTRLVGLARLAANMGGRLVLVSPFGNSIRPCQADGSARRPRSQRRHRGALQRVICARCVRPHSPATAMTSARGISRRGFSSSVGQPRRRASSTQHSLLITRSQPSKCLCQGRAET